MSIGFGIKKAESSREPGQFDSQLFRIHFSFATSQDRLKGQPKNGCFPPSIGAMTAFAPFRPMLDDPIGQGPFKTNIMAGLLRFDPLMPHDFLTLRLKLAVQRRLLDQIIAIRSL